MPTTKQYGRIVSVLALALAVAACGPTPRGVPGDADGGVDGPSTDGVPLPHELVSITVTPTNPLVELDVGVAGSQVFVATGVYRDGVAEDLSAQVTWAVANPAVGAMNGARLAIPIFAVAAAESSRVTATLGTVVGEAQITVVAYRRSGSTQDFFFILPYQDPAGQQRRPLDFATAIPALDVFLLMDTTGSMFGSISNLQIALSGTVVPGIRAEVPDAQFGVGAFEDFPAQGYGSPTSCPGAAGTPDQPFHLFRTITADVASVQSGVASLSNGSSTIGCGNDWPEAGIEALYQAATGNGVSAPSPTNVPANHTGVGGVAFRASSMPVIVQISDAMMHGPGETRVCEGQSANYTGAVAANARSRAATKTALAAICARVVGIAPIQSTLPESCSAQLDLEDFATATGARVPPAAWDVGVRPAGCAAGQCCTAADGTGRAPDAQGLCPVVFRAATDGTGIGPSIVTGIRMLTRFATFDVNSERSGGTADVDGHPLPSGHTTADFLKAITPVSFVVPPAPPVLPNPSFDTVSFRGVTPGTRVSFNVNALNDFVEETGQAQFFRANIRVLAGGCTALDQRDVLILVPPQPVIIE